MNREIAKQHLINFIERQLIALDFLDSHHAKRSIYDQAFGAVMYYTTIAAAGNQYYADVEVLWEQTYKPLFEEKIYG